MTAISSAGHFQFLDGLKQKVHSLDKEQQERLKVEVEQLHTIYQQYQYQLSTLRQLLNDYEAAHRKIRVALRKQQIIQKRQACI